jgi:hypothetical protein
MPPPYIRFLTRPTLWRSFELLDATQKKSSREKIRGNNTIIFKILRIGWTEKKFDAVPD